MDGLYNNTQKYFQPLMRSYYNLTLDKNRFG